MKRAVATSSTCEEFDSDSSSIGSDGFFPAEEEEEEDIEDGCCVGEGDSLQPAYTRCDHCSSGGIPAVILRKLQPSFSEGGPEYSGVLRFMMMDVVLKNPHFTRGSGPKKWSRKGCFLDGGGGTHALLFGREAHGGSVCVIVEGWYPYLLVKAPENWKDTTATTSDCCYALKEMLEVKLGIYFSLTSSSRSSASMGGGGGSGSGLRGGFIHNITTVLSKNIYGYSPEGLVPFLKIEMQKPFWVNAMHNVFVGYPIVNKDAFEAGAFLGDDKSGGGRIQGVVLFFNEQSGGPVLNVGQTETYNSNFDPIQQFMVGVGGLKGCQWIEIPFCTDADCFLLGDNDESKISTCTYEKRVKIEQLTLLNIDEHSGIAPLRILSFDIEAAGRRGVFPHASIDPVIQIALQFHVVGEIIIASEQSYKPILLSLKSCNPIEGADVICFEDERKLLEAFREIVVAFDVDIFTGYNICNFDFLYLKDRAAALGCYEESNDQGDDLISNSFGKMTRLKASQLVLRETEFVSAQMGKRKRVRVTIPGRVSLDMLTSIQNNHRLEGYSLNAVSEHFLGDKKVDLPFTQITPMWMKGADTRCELGVYCLKDAKLPIDLMNKLNALLQTVEMARCTGVPFDWVLQRGTMVRTTYLLLERALQRGFVFPNISPFAKQVYLHGGDGRAGILLAQGLKKSSGADKYKGATVFEPTSLGSNRNVVVLDYAALYPSIIIAGNLCFSTYISDPSHPYNKKLASATDDERGLLRMNEHVFVSEVHCKGLIPEVVEYILSCRKKAKVALAEATTLLDKSLCKARELAYKVIANSMYGVLGSKVSFLPLKAMAETITGVGRQDLENAKRIAEGMYSGCSVIYGDTDSIFVKMPQTEEISKTTSMEEALAIIMDMSKALAARINSTLKKPKKIEDEKVYSVLLLLGKKCYAGMMYPNGHKFGIDEPKIDIKGLQCARRDGCHLVRSMVQDVICCILKGGAEEDAAALVRERLVAVMEDKVPLEEYAIRKTIRKTMQDCCFPMTQVELASVRSGIKSKNSVGAGAAHHSSDGGLQHQPQLTYAEQDEAIQQGIKIPWTIRINLPAVWLAWRIRLKDVGIAPVPGESIQYIITNNGGKRGFEKVETLDAVRAKFIPVDREYYIKAVFGPMNKIFYPIAQQKLLAGNEKRAALTMEKKGKDKKNEDLQVSKMVDGMIWFVTRNRHFKTDPERKRACIAASPIFQAFERQSKKKGT